MSEWQEKTVGEICKVKGGKRLPAGKEFADGVTPFPYLRVKDMVNGTIDQSSIVYVKPEIEPFIRNYKISKNDIYVTIAGTLGTFGTIPDILDNAQLTENAAKLCEIDFDEFDKDFLTYFLNSEKVQLQINRQIGIGGGVPKLALFRIEKLVLKYPEKTSQIKIALILSSADAVIEKTQAAIAKYKAIKQGMLHDLFTRGIDPATSKLRPKYKDAPHLYKPSKLGWIPKEWEVETFSGIVEIINGGTPSTHIKEYWNGEIPWLSVEDFNKEKRYVYDATKKISESGLKNSATNILKKDMIIRVS
ncbi:Type I restriction enzyme StySJI specificity protein (fragment) [uncultured Desulfobacterium sp.]|uniref:Type I restriction enzyme StySJI specificity protein n=1 Tax=uncultured Desulfobacterium sp. TaxID=201089 RepID=A0A445MUZ5_9BACT